MAIASSVSSPCTESNCLLSISNLEICQHRPSIVKFMSSRMAVLSVIQNDSLGISAVIAPSLYKSFGSWYMMPHLAGQLSLLDHSILNNSYVINEFWAIPRSVTYVRQTWDLVLMARCMERLKLVRIPGQWGHLNFTTVEHLRRTDTKTEKLAGSPQIPNASLITKLRELDTKHKQDFSNSHTPLS